MSTTNKLNNKFYKGQMVKNKFYGLIGKITKIETHLTGPQLINWFLPSGIEQINYDYDLEPLTITKTDAIRKVKEKGEGLWLGRVELQTRFSGSGYFYEEKYCTLNTLTNITMDPDDIFYETEDSLRITLDEEKTVETIEEPIKTEDIKLKVGDKVWLEFKVKSTYDKYIYVETEDCDFIWDDDGDELAFAQEDIKKHIPAPEKSEEEVLKDKAKKVLDNLYLSLNSDAQRENFNKMVETLKEVETFNNNIIK
jgi:hypothetical protein